MLYTFFASLFVGNEKCGWFPPESGRETAAAKRKTPAASPKGADGGVFFKLTEKIFVSSKIFS